MSKTKKLNGTLIGLLFTIANVFLASSLLPAVIAYIPIKMLLKSIFPQNGNETSDLVLGSWAIVICSLLALAVILFMLNNIRKRVLRKGRISSFRIIIFMIPLFFLFHPLGGYIKWSLDGFDSFGNPPYLPFLTIPFSSFGFLFFGILIDWMKKPLE